MQRLVLVTHNIIFYFKLYGGIFQEYLNSRSIILELIIPPYKKTNPLLTIFCPFKTEREPCHPNPCHNGGRCLSTSEGFVCRCATGYRGETCTGQLLWVCNKQVVIQSSIHPLSLTLKGEEKLYTHRKKQSTRN